MALTGSCILALRVFKLQGTLSLGPLIQWPCFTDGKAGACGT